jgi:ABC-2 type transport system permease protein
VRYPLNAFFRMFEPLIWLTPVYFLGKSFSTPGGNAGFAAYAGTGDYMSFILLGTVLSNYVAAAFWGMGFSLKNEMNEGVLETNWMAPVPRPLFLVGQTLASLGITTFNSTGMLVLAWALFGFRITGNILAALGALVPLLMAIYGFGFAFAALVLLMRDANTLVDMSNFLLSLLAGSSFPVRALPRFLLPLSLALPLTYGYDAVRGSLLHTRTVLPLRDEMAILLVFMGVLIPLGYAVFKRIERRCKVLGTLGRH